MHALVQCSQSNRQAQGTPNRHFLVGKQLLSQRAALVCLSLEAENKLGP